MAGGTLAVCCCGGGGPEPGPCINPCAIHSVAISILGLAACPDIVQCSSGGGFCPFPTPYTPYNTQRMGLPPNGTHVGYPCPPPASGCVFNANLNQPFTPPTGNCPCSVPHTVNPIQQTVCEPGAVLTPSFITVTRDTGGPGGTIRIINASARTIVDNGRVCSICCAPFGNPTPVVTSEDLQYLWQLPFGGATGVSPEAFCAGTAVNISGIFGGLCRPCGFNGPGTWGTNHQASSEVELSVSRIN